MTSRTVNHLAQGADPAKLLEQLPLFYDFSHEEIKKVAAHAQVAFFEPRETIYRPGDHGDHVYLVVSGLVRLAARDDGETTPDDLIVRSRSVFGEDCASDDSPRVMSAIALMRTHCVMLTRQGLQRLEEQHPRVALKLLRKFARITGQRLHQAVGKAAASATPIVIASAPPTPAHPAFVNRTLVQLERALAALVTIRRPKAV